ncbi:hypothetical protein [Spiroplasma chrysopicola]|uniref:Uncharacterized protein n=1 Tax=Spiroplasma chrysopicola DF-1 TaxID=1276227 RepID=R4UF06_9MOLU|nr:hypothetical protein [Spiroplasma chrysopicola]AGM24690.1 hypothetical protein SCHRY_v1c01030 [Spiroplasma chrysopicola DF-1]
MGNLLINGYLWKIILAVVIFLILIYLIWRFRLFFGKKRKEQDLQLPEYINDKWFIASDHYQLATLGTITPETKTILLAVHDIYGKKENFQALVNNKQLKPGTVVITFDQRIIQAKDGTKIQDLGMLINDINDVLLALSNKYENKKIVLLLEGYCCFLGQTIIKKNNFIKSLILLNPVTNKKVIKFSIASKIALVWGFFFNSRLTINVKIDYKVFTNNEEYLTAMTKSPKRYYLNQILRFHRRNAYLAKEFNALQIPTLLITNTNNRFYQEKELAKIKNPKVEVLLVKEEYQYLFANNLGKEDKQAIMIKMEQYLK